SMIMDATNFPAPVAGAISPKPTVVSVTMAQYIDIGILVYPCSGPSMINITVPITRTMVTTEKRKIWIFILLALKASIKYSASDTYLPSFSILITLNRRKALTTVKNCVLTMTKLK